MTARPRLRVVHGSGLSAPAGTRPPSDADILTGLESREHWAAAALYDRIHSVVERTLTRVLQQRGADFEDLVQDTFERIVRTLLERRFAAGCSLTTWAAAIATNVAIDALRARIRRRRIFALDPVDAADGQAGSCHGADDRLEARAEIARLQIVLGSMRPDRAQAVFMHDLLGHNLAELAAIAGVTVAAAQSRLVRGRAEFLRKARLPAEEGPSREE
ncbi:MAG: RNA polymerase sigma factor [Polyangiaceae bacterium]|nr:RNA polymerase sigma factor [Polyangiaceae bacterium]